MAKLSITWTEFTVHKKHDIDRDRPYLWIFGIIVDAETLVSKDFVVRRPCESDNLGKKYSKGDCRPVPGNLDIAENVTPIFGFMAGGVVVVAWENATTRNKVTAAAYDAAADAINEFIKERVEAANLDTPTDSELAGLSAEIAEDVRSTIRDGWTVFQMVPDHNIGTADCLLKFEGAYSRSLDFRFRKNSTDYQLRGRLEYTG